MCAVLGFGVRPAAARAADEQPFTGRLELTLDGALRPVRINGPASAEGAERQPLSVYARCDALRWSDVWGQAEHFNRGVHEGRVDEGRVTADGVTLHLTIDVDADNWVKGGEAAFDVELRRRGAELEGTWSGTFAGESAKGTARGELLPPVEVERGFSPPARDEHPRLLFRKSELPAIRAKAQTPLGKAIVERLATSPEPVAMGMMYQLTGEKTWAQKAFDAAERVMDQRDGGALAVGRVWGYRAEAVACTFDLCRDAWDEKQLVEARDYLDWVSYRCIYKWYRLGSVNPSPGSNYAVVLFPGGAMAAEAVLGERGVPPAEPPAPTPGPLHVAPDARPVTEGVPVSPLPLGQTPTAWLTLGPFRLNVNAGDDCLASAGGAAAVRPTPGEKVNFRGQTCEWKPLSREKQPGMFHTGGYQVPPGAVVIDTPKLGGPREHSRLFLYTVVENDAPGWYRFRANNRPGAALCWLAGQRVLDGQCVRLDKGRYPLLMTAAFLTPEGQAYPWFEPATEEQAKVAEAEVAARYDADHKAWEAQVAAWNAAGGEDPQWQRTATRGRRLAFLCCRLGMGDGGFQGEGEGYTLECHHVLHDYAVAFRNFAGADLTGHPDIGYFAPRYVMTTVFPEGAGDAPPRRRGCEEFGFSQSFGGHGGGTIPARYLGRSIALCSPQWRPALHWFWDRRMGVTPEGVSTEAGAREAFAWHDDPIGLIFALLNYPQGPQGQPEQSPEQIMPHVWQAASRGFYCFRDHWNGKDDIVAQIYGKCGEPCGWNQGEAGCFQVQGLGHVWAWKDEGPGKTGSRWHDNVVMLPDDPVDAWGLGQTTFFRGDDRTGGGVVTFNLDGVYRGLRQIGEGKSAHKEPFDAGIRGLRSFAADYSGACGAPALFAVADHVTGGGRKQWLFQLPAGEAGGRGERGEHGASAAVNIGKNEFTLRYPDGASMRVTFVAPADVRLTEGSGKLHANPLSGVEDVPGHGVLLAEGGDGRAGDFLIVMTLQKGDAPEVKVAGEGAAAKATVGHRVVGFDGRNVMIETPR